MSTKRWTVELDGRRHEVVLQHGYFSARRRVTVDGLEVLDLRPGPVTAVRYWNTATEHPLVIAGHAAAIRVDPTVDNMTYKKLLIVDGRDVDSGALMTPLPENAAGSREGQWLAGHGGIGGFILSMVLTAAAVALFQLLQRR